MSRYQKGKTNLDITEARDSEWQWHQLKHMQVCTSLQTDNHANTPPLSFLQAGCPSCRPTKSVKALKASLMSTSLINVQDMLICLCSYLPVTMNSQKLTHRVKVLRPTRHKTGHFQGCGTRTGPGGTTRLRSEPEPEPLKNHRFRFRNH